MRNSAWHEFLNLPPLNIDNWSAEGQVIKMLEELGEVAQVFTKRHDRRKIASETMDVIRTGISMLDILEKEEGMDLDPLFMEHIKKLHGRGYLK